MTDKWNNQDREAGRILDGLERLSRALDRERFPGAAWQRPAGRTRRTILRIIWPAAATAAAAVLLLAVVMFYPQQPQTRKPVTRSPIVHPSPSRTYSDAPVEWSVPTDLDPAVAASVTFDVPGFDLTTTGSDGTAGDPAEWSLPSLSLPAMPDVDAGPERFNDV